MERHNKGVLEDAFELQQSEADDALREALKGVLVQEDIARFLIDQIKPAQQQFIFLSGLGSAWPLISGHSLLNTLHAAMGHTPTTSTTSASAQSSLSMNIIYM